METQFVSKFLIQFGHPICLKTLAESRVNISCIVPVALHLATENDHSHPLGRDVVGINDDFTLMYINGTMSR